MRKVTKAACDAFHMGRTGHFGSNTVVELSPLGNMLVMKLHGNAIARKDMDTGKIEVRDGGWQSNTTKERLNGINGVSVYQRNFQWFLNGVEWSGNWTEV